MTPEEVEHVFERFYRAGAATGRRAPAWGWRSSSRSSTCTAATIDVDTAPGEGTRFTVPLPARPPRPSSAARPRDALRGRRVLVIDDEPDDRAADRRAPGAVRRRADDRPRRRRARSRGCAPSRFDAMTLDILMPGMSGFEVLRALRADPRAARAAGRRRVGVLRARGAGRRVGRGKPIDAEELADALGAAVLAGRVRVLVVGRADVREQLRAALDELGIEHEWASTRRSRRAAVRSSVASRSRWSTPACPHPEAALAALDLRGRRLRRRVVVVSPTATGPGLARLDASRSRIDERRARSILGPAGAQPTAADLLALAACRGLCQASRRPPTSRAAAGADLASVERSARREGAPARALRRRPARDVQAGARARARSCARSYMATVRALSNAVEARDAYTGKHAERVAAYGMELARALGLAARRRPRRSSSASCCTTSARSRCPTRSCSSPSR